MTGPYTITPGPSFTEVAAAHHGCQLPLSGSTSGWLHCDPRGVVWYSIPHADPQLRVPLAAIPEPSVGWLLLAGLAILIWKLKR